MWNRGRRPNDPLSLLPLVAASSPKGTPLRYAGNLIATTKSRPLGESGIAIGDDGRGSPASNPLSLLTAFAASSPKGTPLRYAGNLIATAKSRPLGEGGLTRSGKTEGVISARISTFLTPKVKKPA